MAKLQSEVLRDRSPHETELAEFIVKLRNIIKGIEQKI